jgi:hypothetical protein
MKVKSITELKETIHNSLEMQNSLTDNPIEFISKLQDSPPMLDKKVFMIVVYIVGGILLATIVLAAMSILPVEYNEINGKKEVVAKDVNDFFIMIGSACIGALAGLLTPTPNQ